MLATVCVVMMSTAVLSEAPQPESSEERAATSFSYYATNYGKLQKFENSNKILVILFHPYHHIFIHYHHHCFVNFSAMYLTLNCC